MPIMAPKGKVFPLTVELGNYENFPAFPVNAKGLTVKALRAARASSTARCSTLPRGVVSSQWCRRSL